MRLLALFTVGLLALSPPVRASDSSQNGTSVRSDSLRQGTERSSTKVVLLPTPAAPAGARGTAQLETANGRGGTLLVKTEQLSPGGYWLRAVRRSDSSAVNLGLMAIINPEFEPDRQAGDHPTNERSSAYPTDFLQSQIRVELPPDLPPEDIDQIILSYPGGNDLLRGTVTAR